MKAFHTIAIPHKDILEGRLTLDVYAADLHQVSLNSGPDEYRDSKKFFQKTYLTNGLNNLLNVVEKRINGSGGDPVIQLQTPFGGGKTHSLIALYHKAKQWNAKTVVIVGEKIEATDTLWGIIEKQLTGKVEKFKDKHAPGGEALKELIESHQPVLILMDEVLQYITRAAAVKVEASNLAAQSIAFMQALTETISSIPNAVLLLSLPSSVPEHYDENAEKLYSQLQKVSGRLEKIFTPVEDNEITKIIRRRLFSSIDEKEAENIVQGYVDYLEKENLLPTNTQPSEYREQFLYSYPFIPEVIDVLYKRWGSFPQFQRTRGVLRLLAIVISSLKNSKLPYITLADFDLGNQDIRQELLRHIDSTFNSVIASDISDKNSGASRVNEKLGPTYQGLALGTRTATTIFMYSHSGGTVKGATVPEVKRSAVIGDIVSAIIDSAFDELEKELFYIQKFGDKYLFSNMPNINKIVLTYMENVKDSEIEKFEYDLLKEQLSSNYLKVYFWENKSNNIVDDENLKLVILREGKEELIKEIIKKKGSVARTKSNTIFVLYPSEIEKGNFLYLMKRKIAFENILKSPNLNLSNDQKKEINKELGRIDSSIFEALRKYYRFVAIPNKESFKVLDLGIPTYGDVKSLVDEVYEKLIVEKEILEKLSPAVLKSKYLSDKDYVRTEAIYNSSLSTPGEFRLSSRKVLESSIEQGVLTGQFGLGITENNQPICKYFKKNAQVYFSEDEVLIKDSICIEQIKQTKIVEEKIDDESTASQREIPEQIPEPVVPVKHKTYQQLSLCFSIPKGKVSSIMSILNYLQSKYENLEITIKADKGNLTEQEYEYKIKEALRQIGVDLKN